MYSFHPLLAIIPLITTTLAYPQGYSSVVQPVVTNTSLTEGDGTVDCARHDSSHSNTPYTWECANAIQLAPRTGNVQTFRGDELPRTWLAGKCFIILTYAGDTKEGSLSFSDIQNAAVQLMTACQRSGGYAENLPRSGGLLKIGSDFKLKIVLSKPPKNSGLVQATGRKGEGRISVEAAEELARGVSGGLEADTDDGTDQQPLGGTSSFTIA